VSQLACEEQLWKTRMKSVWPSIGKQVPGNFFPTISTDMEATIPATIVPVFVL
jgi:hypothetical protein